VRRRAGFTLVELIIAAGTLLVLCAATAFTLIVAMRYWTSCGDRALAERNARAALSIITAEVRQALPAENAATGYHALTPAVDATGLLTPNANSVQSDALVFTEPDPTGYQPDSSGWNVERGDICQRVRYYTRDGAIYREVTRFTATGGVAQTSEDPVVAAQDGALALACTFTGPESLRIAVTSRKGASETVLQSRVTTLGH